MKTSLGRRSSSRNPPRMVTFTEFGSAKKDKKSAIPVRRTHSADRKNLMATPIGKRSGSEDRNSMLMTPATSRKTFGTERPSRATTSSTNSTRLSSFGGARAQRDCRPIEDKEWQNNAQRKIEKFLIEDVEGCAILNNGSIRPLTLKIFIDVVDLLLRRIINAGQDSYINKTNYITELPYIMKKLLYRGKLEKSWLISVNTIRSWCHALACMEFLVSMVCTQLVVDVSFIMYPETSCKEEEEDIWDYKLLLSYVQESYDLFVSGDENYEEQQKALDTGFVNPYISNDVYHHIDELQIKIQNIEQHCEDYKARIQIEKPELDELGMKYNNLKDKRATDENKLKNLAAVEEDFKRKTRKMERERNELRETLRKKQEEKHEIESVISTQEVSPHEIEKLKQRRESLQREIEAEHKYLEAYNDIVMKSSMEVLALKKKNAELIQGFNIAVLEYISLGLENVALTGKKDNDEKVLNTVEAAINSAKKVLQVASEYCSNYSVSKAQDELNLIEEQCFEEKSKFSSIIEKLQTSIYENEEAIKRIKNEEQSIIKKINDTLNDPEEKELLEERKIRIKKMSEQLNLLRQNGAIYIQRRGDKLDSMRNIMKELTEKYKEINASLKQQLHL